jgi:hypothetical protein
MTGSLNTREPDPERARRIAEHGLILRGLVGSTVHGLSNPGTDDRDEMGAVRDRRTGSVRSSARAVRAAL